jgi:hypothetical protein
MLKGHMMLIGLLLGLSVTFAGCAGNLPQPERADTLDAHWSKSIQTAKSDQVLNPEAGKEPTPVEGFDGQSANTQLRKYRKTLQERKKVKETVGIGRSISSSGRR